MRSETRPLGLALELSSKHLAKLGRTVSHPRGSELLEPRVKHLYYRRFFGRREGDARACIDRDSDRLLRRLRSRDASQPLAQLRGFVVVQGDHPTPGSDLKHLYATPAVDQGKSSGKSFECIQASI